MTSVILECGLNSAGSIKHDASNSFWTNTFNKELVLNPGDTVNCILATINSSLTGSAQVIQLDSTKGENVGYIKVQFMFYYTVQNLQNNNDQLEWKAPVLLNPQINPNDMLYDLANNRFVTNNLTITLDPNQEFWSPDEIAQRINEVINETFCVNRLATDATGINTNRGACLNPLQTMVYTTNNGANYKATTFAPNGSSANDVNNVTDVTGAISSKFINSSFILGASAPVFSWNSNASGKFAFSFLHSPILNYGTTAGATNNPSFSIQMNGSTVNWGLNSSFAVIDLGGSLFQKLGFNIVANSVINSPSIMCTYSTSNFARPSVNFQGGPAVSQPDWVLSFNPTTLPKFFDWNSTFYYSANSIFFLDQIGYFLLKSDIATDGNFYSSQAKDELQIISFLNKNYQGLGGLMYYCFTQSNPIIIKTRKVIKTISFQILQPDLSTPVGLLPNSCVFLQILKA